MTLSPGRRTSAAWPSFGLSSRCRSAPGHRPRQSPAGGHVGSGSRLLTLFLEQLAHDSPQPATARVMMEFAMPELFDRDPRRGKGQLDDTHTGRNGGEIARQRLRYGHDQVGLSDDDGDAGEVRCTQHHAATNLPASQITLYD